MLQFQCMYLKHNPLKCFEQKKEWYIVRDFLIKYLKWKLNCDGKNINFGQNGSSYIVKRYYMFSWSILSLLSNDKKNKNGYYACTEAIIPSTATFL